MTFETSRTPVPSRAPVLATWAMGALLLVATPSTSRAETQGSQVMLAPAPSATLAPSPALSPPSASPLSPPSSGPRVDDSGRQLRYALGVSSVGIGALMLVVGSVLGVRAIVDKGQIGTSCDRLDRCNLAGYTLASEAKDFAAISTVMFVTGLTLEAIGIPLLVSARKSSPPPVTARLRVSPSGLAVAGSF